MLFTAVCISADFEITEIMYDLDGADTNREWLEVKNAGELPADLSEWYLFSENTKHSLVPQKESIIPSGSYAVIAQNVSQFKNDWPNYAGFLFDSSWTGFKNSGESISLKDPDLNIVSFINFSSNQGGAGNGESLQKINGNWAGSLPTPGIENKLAKIKPILDSSKIKNDIISSSGITEISSTQNSGMTNKNEDVINLNDIKETIPKNKINMPVSIYPYIGLAIVIGLGITSFLVFKNKFKKEKETENKLTAKDIMIIE